MIGRILCPALVLGAVSFVPNAFAQTAEAAFHHAYFLERERGHFEEALALYEEVARDPAADPALKQEAARRAKGVAEEIAGADLAGLLPAGAILYAEFKEPGRQVSGLLEQLGLLGTFEDAARKGSLAINPELVRGLLGIRGAALAITRLPTGDGPPGGVLVLHPGDVALLRGLIETAVPAGGIAADPIEGHPTWSLQGEILVSLTERLVVVSPEREEIAGVLRRLRGEASDALVGDPSMREFLAQRKDALLFCCLNAVPARAVIAELLGRAAQRNPRVNQLRTLLDVGSVKAVVARAGVAAEGLSLDVALHLEQDHRNLVFNLLRPAPIDARTLELVPQGAAAFVATAFNERGPATGPLHQNVSGAPVVTAMDFGRELFANAAGLALFVLPGEGMIPDVALVLSSNDSARSRAVLGLILGAVNLAATGRTLEPDEDQVGGAEAQVFRVPPGIPLYLVLREEMLLLSPSRVAIERALQARQAGAAVRADQAYRAEIERIGPGTNLVVMAQLGRCLAAARPFLPQEPWRRIEPVAPLLQGTTVALRAEHSDAKLGLSLALAGIPRIDGLVGQQLERMKERRAPVRTAISRDRMQSQGAASELLARGDLDLDRVRQRFDLLALESEDEAAACAFVRGALPGLSDDPKGLNNLAWALLTEERYRERFDQLALEIATAANRASGFSDWRYLDTLALAKFRTGALQEAVELEESALQRVADGKDRADVEDALQRFRAALGGAVVSDSKPR